MAGPFLGHFEKVQAIAATARLVGVGGRRARGDSAFTLFDHVANKPKATAHLPCAVNALAAGKAFWLVGGDDGVLRKFDDEGKATGEVKFAASIAAIFAICSVSSSIAFGFLVSIIGIFNTSRFHLSANIILFYI